MRWQNGSVRLQKRRKGIKMMLEYAKQEENEVEEARKTEKQNSWNRQIITFPKPCLEAQQAYLHEY
jgi:hypothetical protein